MLYISMSVFLIKLELKLVSLCFGVSVPVPASDSHVLFSTEAM